MVYTQVSVRGLNEEQKELLIALLSVEGYEGFEETPDALNAFIPAPDFNERALGELLVRTGGSYTIQEIQETNWNKEWESNFEPVTIGDFCVIRADFHAPQPGTAHEIIITPKMSFGTGHHATTQMMIRQMRHLVFTGRKVLDFGTGTGVLAILAEKLGASQVLAIDNDEWSISNTLENMDRNAAGFQVRQGSLEVARGERFDIILANINRHILLAYAAELRSLITAGGTLLLSGLLEEDKEVVVPAYEEAGFKLQADDNEGKWIALLFQPVS